MIRPFGEAALLVELTSSTQALALAASLGREPLPGVDEVVPGLSSLLVELAEPWRASEVADSLTSRLAALQAADVAGIGRPRVIPVVYGGEHGPDLAEVAALGGLSSSEAAALHAATELRVLFDGFAPGFAYLGELPEALHVPRLATPRTRTPAGSVAVAGSMSGIYPAVLPGGWRIIGRTPDHPVRPDARPSGVPRPG